MKLRKLLVFIFILFQSYTLGAQELTPSLDLPKQYQLEGAIPIGFHGQIATDLLDENGGKLDRQRQIELKRKAWKGSFDFSFLQPEENYYWQDQIKVKKPLRQLNIIDTSIQIANQNSVQYFYHGSEQEGEAIAFVQKNGKAYKVHFRKENYQSLMLKTLLRKIGYFIPAMKEVRRLRINFDSLSEKKLFKLFFESQFGASIPNWIYSDPKNEPYILVQDVVVSNAKNYDLKNLAIAPFLVEQDTYGKRTFKSLAIPYTVLNFDGNLNLLSWKAAQIESGNIFLDYQYTSSFNPTYEDARWMLRRMRQLSRDDWIDIVRSTRLSAAVQKGLVERVISRYDSLLDVFDTKLSPIGADYKISYSDDLHFGKLVRCHYPGYAATFCGPDPEAPFTSRDFWPYVKSKATSLAYKGLFAFFNSRSFMRTKFNRKNQENIDNIVAQAITDFEETGKETDILKQSWSYDFFKLKLVARRKLIAGPYQGSSQLLNQVDSVSMSVSLGKYFATTGYNEDLHPKNFYPENGPGPRTGLHTSPISVQAGAHYSKTWAHVTPVHSISDANKLLPIKRALLPFLQKARGNIFKEVEEEYRNTDCSEERIAILQNKAREKLEELKEHLRIGQSYIIMDTVAVGAEGELTASYKKLAELQIASGSNYQVISRLHIHRAGENTLHFYKNRGNLTRVHASAELSANAPIMRFHYEGIPGGTASTDFYKLTIDPDDPDILEKVIAIRHVLTHGSLKPLKKILEKKKYIFKYKFSEGIHKIGILWFNFNKVRSNNIISVIPPSQNKMKFLRNYYSKLSGKNKVNYGVETIEKLLSQHANININLITPPLNPGFSLSGHSENEIAIYEAELDENDEPKSQFIHTIYGFNGWKNNRDQIDSYLKKIEKRYHHNFFRHNDLAETTKMQIYHLAVHLYVYDQGIEELLNMPEKEVLNTFTQFHTDPWLEDSKGLNFENKSGYTSFIGLRKSYFRHRRKKRWKKMARKLNEIVIQAQKNINIEGLKKLFGGDENFYLYAGVGGFRQGVQNPGISFDSNLTSDTFGSLGPYSEYASTKYTDQREFSLSLIEKNINRHGTVGISRGELFINWILTRAN